MANINSTNDTFYEIENCLNGDIILTPIDIDLTKYDKQLLNNGKIIFKYRAPIEVKISELNNYNIKGSCIYKCIINNRIMNYNKYRSILYKIYSIIGDGSDIIKNTTLNIKTLNRNDSGFVYKPELGISIQGADSSKTLNEILIQCKENNIQLQLQIKLVDLKIISITI